MPKKRNIVRLPLAKVKRLLREDDEVGKVSKHALTTVASAMEQFLCEIVFKVHAQFATSTKSIISPQDMLTVLKREKRYNFLLHYFQDEGKDVPQDVKPTVKAEGGSGNAVPKLASDCLRDLLNQIDEEFAKQKERGLVRAASSSGNTKSAKETQGDSSSAANVRHPDLSESKAAGQNASAISSTSVEPAQSDGKAVQQDESDGRNKDTMEDKSVRAKAVELEHSEDEDYDD